MFGIRGFLMKDELYKSFVEELYNRLDKDRYPTTNRNIVLHSRHGNYDPDQIHGNVLPKSFRKRNHHQVLTEEMTILERGMCTQTSQQS